MFPYFVCVRRTEHDLVFINAIHGWPSLRRIDERGKCEKYNHNHSSKLCDSSPNSNVGLEKWCCIFVHGKICSHLHNKVVASLFFCWILYPWFFNCCWCRFSIYVWEVFCWCAVQDENSSFFYCLLRVDHKYPTHLYNSPFQCCFPMFISLFFQFRREVWNSSLSSAGSLFSPQMKNRLFCFECEMASKR